MIYAIGDLHFDFSKEKPMDIFGEKWVHHEEKILDNWKNLIKPEDLILLPGDISWALKLNIAKLDLERIDDLPGKKIIMKGNHDYWWTSLSKLNNLKLKSIFFLYNNSYKYKETGIVGTRGWISKDNEDFTKDDEKIFASFGAGLDACRYLGPGGLRGKGGRLGKGFDVRRTGGGRGG